MSGEVVTSVTSAASQGDQLRVCSEEPVELDESPTELARILLNEALQCEPQVQRNGHELLGELCLQHNVATERAVRLRRLNDRPHDYVAVFSRVPRCPAFERLYTFQVPP